MRMALAEAVRGWGRCSPNPMVGAVIVRDGEVLGLGYHREAGRNHAEINALQSVPADADLRQATLYVTLEPCSTHGRTPPCCDAILKAGVGRIVIGCPDANPLHAGRGMARLRQAGVEVLTGVLEEECRRLNEHFFWWITRRRPWVILKMAMSLDGKIALPDGRSRWISGAAARSHVQKLRQLAGMVMVGGRTARLDNPELIVREPADWEHQPIPAVWTSHPLPDGLKLTSNPRRPVVSAKPQTRAEWESFLSAWGGREVTVLLLEGGGELAANALACGIVNQVQFFIAPKIIGGRDAAPVVGGKASPSLDQALRLERVETRFVGEDLLYVGYPIMSDA